MNERDSEIIGQSLVEYGFYATEDMFNADLVILNTCSIREKAEQKVLSLLGYLRKAKSKKPTMKICVAGCVAQQEGNRLLARMPHIDLVIGTQNIYAITELLEKVETQGSLVITTLNDIYDIPLLLPQLKPSKETQFVKEQSSLLNKFVTIMQGCNNYCTYCVVPYTRGRENSRNVSDILKEVHALVNGGVSEITLLGQNVNSFGKTNNVLEGTGNYSFADLIKDVAGIEGLKRLRFTTSNPKDLTWELIKCFSEVPVLCPQFHLPVQSGSDNILKKMNRKYSVQQYLQLVDELRDVCPEIALTTDVIIGFPGETNDNFQETLELLEKVRFHGSFSFKYSDRPGTRASNFPDKIPEEIKSERLAVFQKRQDEISREKNNNYIGKIKTVLLEDCSDGKCKGRTDTNHIVHINDQADKPIGTYVDVMITAAGNHSLQGKWL